MDKTEYNKKYRLDHITYFHEYDKERYLTNKDDILVNKKEDREKYPDKYKKRDKLNYRKLRIQVIMALGEKCVDCRTMDIRVLDAHHINGGGSQQFKTFGNYKKYYKYIIDNPTEFLLLCANCHRIRHYGDLDG
jgi:hypothetical protein